MLNKYRYFIMGLIVGVIAMLSVGAMANSNSQVKVATWLVNNVQFIFNGEYKSVPEEYGGVLIYNDRTYVPTRFVAENLEAEVSWDEESRTARISSKPCPVCNENPNVSDEKKEEKEEDKEEPSDIKEKEKESGQPKGDYRSLPLNKYYKEMEVAAISVNLSDDQNNIFTENNTHTRIYLRVENKGDSPLQLQQSKAIAIVDGKEYKASKLPNYRLDDVWYNDINTDDIVEGYISLPLIPEDAKEMKLTLFVLENDWRQTEREIELDIALELN